MNKNKGYTIISVVLLLIIAVSIITIASVTLLSEAEKTNQNLTNETIQDIITVNIADGTIKINIIGEKYKELNSYSVTTNLGEVIIDGKTEIKYNPELPQMIPFSEKMTSIKIIGHFENGTDSEIFSGNIKPGIVAASINPADVKVTVKFESKTTL